MRYKIMGGGLLFVAAMLGVAQTKVDLRSQTRNVDFADATATRPFAVGASLPENCSPGQAFFKSNAPTGENLYLCTATDTWSVGGASAPYFKQFPTADNTWSVSGEAHGLGADVEVFVQEDDGANWKRSYPGSVLINKINGDITVTWSEPRAGRLMVSGLRGGGGASGGTTAAGPHAAQHKHGGSDEVATDVPAAHAIPKADAAGRLSEAWIDAAISRDTEAAAAGDVSGSLASGYQINNQAVGAAKLRAGNAPAAGYYVRVAEDGEQFRYQDPAEILAEAGAAPEVHASQHKHGGSDEVATDVPAAHAIPKADAAGRLSEAWIDAAISRDTEAAAAGDVSGSLASGYQINNQAVGAAKLRAGNAPAAGYYVRVAEDGEQFRYQDPAEILAEAGAAPEVHASQHKHGGSDEVATDVPAAHAIPKADAAGRLSEAWIDAAISRDTEAAAAGDVSGSLASGYQINNQAVGAAKLRAGNAPAAGYYVRVAEDGEQFRYQDPAEILAEAGAAPEVHASQHKHGGSDEVATDVPAAHAIPKADAAGRLSEAWIDAAISRDTEAAAAGDVSGSLASGYQINNQAVGAAKLRAGNAPAAGYYVRVAEDGEQFRYQDPAEILAEAGAAPEVHASQHKHGGSDEVATDVPAAHAIPKADESGQLNRGWLPEMTGDGGSGGQGGAVPAPAAGDASKCLKGDGSWGICLDHAAMSNREAADQHPASAITATPTGGVSATTVQAAIEELDTKKLAISARGEANGVAGLDEAGKVLRSVLPVMEGDSGEGGQAGAVPAPQSGDAGKCLKGDGAWGECTGTVALDEVGGVSGILGAGHGGTGNGFTAFAGPEGETKTFALPDASATILTDHSAVTVAQGGTGISGGNAGGIPYYATESEMASTEELVEGGVVIGGGAGEAPRTTAAGSANQVLRIPDGGGTPAFGAVNLSDGAAVSGTLGAEHGGTGNAFFAVTGPTTTTKMYTFPNASATVLTSAAPVTVAQGGTGIASGVTGGIPYFAEASSIASSGTLAAGAVVLGGGPGAAPTTADQITIQAAGSSGTPVANAGDATTLARSNHEHLIPWQVGMPFTGTPTTGDFAVRLPAPANCGGSISVTSVRVIAANKGTGPMTYQAYSCANGVTETCLSMFSGGNQTYSHTGNVSQQAATDQNNSNLSSSSFFKVNIATVNGQSGVTLIVNGRCKNI